MPASPRAIFFDLDGTLVDRDAAFLACVLEAFGNSPATDSILALDAHGHGDRTALLRAWQLHSGEVLTLHALGARIASRLRPNPDLITALHELAVRLPIGVITNGGSQAQRLKLEAAGLDRVFPASLVFVSAELGIAKPDPALFLHAARRLDIAPTDCLYVGDHEPHDRVGALAAGFQFRLASHPLDASTVRGLPDAVPNA